MKPKRYWPFIIVGIVVAFFWGHSCGKSNNPEIPEGSARLKSKVSLHKDQEKKLKAEIVYKDSIRDRWHTEWREIRHDSLIPCPEKLAIADTVIRADSSLISVLRADISKLDTIVMFQNSIIRIDSTAISQLAPRQMFFVGGDATSHGGIYPGIGIDTRKGLFTISYDPFTRTFKAGAYIKIKGWKRK